MSSKLALFIDEPETEKIVLDFPNYIKTLTELIVNSIPRYTVGIFGSWGTGKTTLMKNIQNGLERKNCTCIEFNAWRFAQEERHATIPLMLTVITTLLQKPEIKSKLQSTSSKLRDLAARVLSGLRTSVSFKIPFLLDVTAEADFKEMLKKKAKDDYDEFIESSKPILQEGIELIKSLLENSKGIDENSDLKLIVFIDDLDRCTPEKATEVLESIKVFFEMKGIVFVLGLSKEIIEAAIDYKYKHLKSSFNGKDYLKKIIQVPFVIPPWSQEEILEFTEKLADRNSDLPYAKFFKKESKLISEAVEPNPREVKRLLNNFILARQIQKNDKDIEDKKLLAVQALAVRWKEFYDVVSMRPEIIPEVLKNATPPSLAKQIAKDLLVRTTNVSLENGKPENPLKIFYEDIDLMKFLHSEGKVIVNLSSGEWQKYRRATIIEPEIESLKKGIKKFTMDAILIEPIKLETLSTINPPHLVDEVRFFQSGGTLEKGKMPQSLAHTIDVDIDSSNTFCFRYIVPVDTKVGQTTISHSSELNLHIILDGQKLGDTNWLGFKGSKNNRLQSDVYAIRNIPSGMHSLTLQPEVKGKYLESWGGTIEIYK